MSKEFICTIKRSIHGKYHLRNATKNSWVVQESHRTIKIRSPNEDSIAFSLDRSDPEPFAFFSASPPDDFARMCDIILFCSHNNEIYLFLIEIKTGRDEGYETQVMNGKLFCDWLIALCIQHKSLNPNAIVVPLLIWKPSEKLLHKGPTTHDRNSDNIKEKSTELFGRRVFEVQHMDTVPIIEVISKLQGSDQAMRHQP